jgi:hypothetical protein
MNARRKIMLFMWMLSAPVALAAALIFQVQTSIPPPVNMVYAGLLSLIALLMAVVGWFVRSAFSRFEGFQKDMAKTQDAQLDLLHQMDKRLVRVETKLGLADKSE